MKIKAHSKIYSVEIVDRNNIEKILNNSHRLIVIDEKVFDIYRHTLLKNIDHSSLYLFKAVESKKNINSALAICKKMAEISFKRGEELLSIGGGIVQDVTGFAANIYNRGVKWTFIPTTLLAQCDSCIGSKTSLNYLKFKNLLGTFYAPDSIYIYLDFVKTLTKDDYLSGLGEVAKFNIMSAKDGIRLLEKNMDKLLDRDIQTLKFFNERSLKFKKTFIEKDEYDFGIRNLLNFAHTFGHAFEKVSNYAIPHGQAVTLGLMTANNISVSRHILNEKKADHIKKLAVRFLSVKLKKMWFEAEQIVNAVKKDKKRSSEYLPAVLFSSSNSLRVFQDIKSDELKEALEHLIIFLEKKNKL
jgi:3-dehydroquinate synthase